MLLKPASRRLRCVSIPEHAVLEVFANWKQADVLSLPVLSLPDGAQVHSVQYDWWCRSFGFLVEHASYPEVPDGREFPRHVGEWEAVKIHGRTIAQLAQVGDLTTFPVGAEEVADLLSECKRIAEAGKILPQATEAERARAALERELEQGPTRTLLALADWEEEQGRPEVAAGYAWLAKYQRWPQRSLPSKWTWAFQTFPLHTPVILLPPHCLPEEMCQKLPGWGDSWFGMPSAPAALQEAAKAAGVWLKEEGGL